MKTNVFICFKKKISYNIKKYNFNFLCSYGRKSRLSSCVLNIIDRFSNLFFSLIAHCRLY